MVSSQPAITQLGQDSVPSYNIFQQGAGRIWAPDAVWGNLPAGSANIAYPPTPPYPIIVYPARRTGTPWMNSGRHGPYRSAAQTGTRDSGRALISRAGVVALYWYLD